MNVRARVVVATLLGIALAICCRPVAALDIVPIFNAGASDSYFDPDNGANRTGELIAIMNAVAARYEDMIEDNHTLTINYFWDDLSDPNGWIGLHTNTTTVGGRETVCNIAFDTQFNGVSRRYFIDPTPDDHSEYDLQTTLYRDLSGANQADWYNGSPNQVLEAGFRGNSAAGAPFDAANGFDLLTVAFHEVGHALGLTGTVATVETQFDFDYDVNPNQVDGAVMAIESSSSTNLFHLDNSLSAMFPSVSTNLRTLPSATDLLAMASASNWADLDLDRKYFNGSGDWNANINWIGGDQPDTTEEAFVVDTNTTATLSGTGSAASLTVSDGAAVNTTDNLLLVSGPTTVDGANSRIIVRPSGTLQTTSIRLQNGGELDVEDGFVDVNGTLTIADSTSSITGRDGTIDVSVSLVNDGAIRPDASDVLTFTTASGSFDLDGLSGNGVIDATNNGIVFDGPVADEFGGAILVGGSETVTFVDGWTLDSVGTLDLNGSPSTTAAIAGGLSIIQGDVDVVGLGRFVSNVTFQSTANVSVAANGRLALDGTTNFAGGAYTGAGELEQSGPGTVSAATTISVQTYDMDGTTGTESITLLSNTGLTLNVTNIDDGSNLYNGTINSNLFATLTVNTPAPWTMAGTLNVEGDAANSLIYSVLAGSPVTLSGQVNIDGPADFTADVTHTGTATTEDSLAMMRFAGAQAHRIQGGTVDGLGRLGITATSSLNGFGTIAATVNSQPGSELLAEDGTLVLSGSILNAGVLGTADSTGSLQVNNAWNTNVADELRLNGGSVTGAAITNDGTTRGRGAISTANFINNGTLSADFGGTLFLNTATFPDLDGGGAETGIINASNGTVLVGGDFGGLFFYDGTLNIHGGEFRMDNRGLHVQSGGLISFAGTGGTYQAPQLSLSTGGTLTTAGAPGRLVSGNMQFLNGGTTTLNSPLELQGTATVYAGTTMTGPSHLEVEPGSTLQGNATLGVGVVNQGTVSPGVSPGLLTVAAFTQEAAGTLRIEIGGTTAGTQYDVLQATGAATLDGALDIDLLAFVPVPGNVFQVLRYSSRVGSFDTIVDQTFGAAAGQFFWPVYRATHLSLYVPLPGDANFDGAVTGADYTIWGDEFGSGTTWAEADFNGDGAVTGADFTIWADNFGSSVPLDSMVAIPEPSSLVLGAALLLWGGAYAIRRRVQA